MLGLNMKRYIIVDVSILKRIQLNLMILYDYITCKIIDKILYGDLVKVTYDQAKRKLLNSEKITENEILEEIRCDDLLPCIIKCRDSEKCVSNCDGGR